jgi:hypothetical protein
MRDFRGRDPHARKLGHGSLFADDGERAALAAAPARIMNAVNPSH